LYQNEKDVIVQVSKFLQIMGIINKTLKPSQVQKHTRLKIISTLALPALLHGCDTWAIREQDKVSGYEIYEENGKVHLATFRYQLRYFIRTLN
jgi:hypothetical protein